MPGLKDGFVLLQEKQEKTGWERNTNCYLISVSPGNISVLASRQKKSPTQTQEKPSAAKQENWKQSSVA